MQSSTARSVLTYGLIGVVLLVAVVLGVQFAKNRSAQVAADKQQTAATQQPANNQPQSQPQPQPEPTPSTPSQPSNQNNSQSDSEETPASQPSSTPTLGATSGHRVPATGIEDSMMVAIALAALAFSGLVYVKSRRELVKNSLV